MTFFYRERLKEFKADDEEVYFKFFQILFCFIHEYDGCLLDASI